MDLTVPADDRKKIKENKKGGKYFDPARKLRKVMEHESNSDTNCKWNTWNEDWKSWKLENVLRLSKLQHC